MKEFNKEGLPVIKIFDDYFEIKALDYSTFRSFNYNEVSKILYFKESDKGNWFFMPWMQVINARTDTFKLKIIKKNGGDWLYETQTKNADSEFENVISQIKEFCDIG